MKPTIFLIRVLNAIEEANNAKGYTSPSWIANKVFPRDHPGWMRSCKCGPYGSTTGSGLIMMMGGYLGKLKHASPPLVSVTYDGNGNSSHILTIKGREVLTANKSLLE